MQATAGPTTRITLIRHAESQMNTRSGEVVGGRSNHTPLTADGAAAATALGHLLATTESAPDVVVCTSALRSAQTARAIVEGAGWDVPISVCDSLIELSQGAAEGQPRDQWWTPAAIAAMHADPLGHRLAPGGESHREVQQRMRSGLHALAAAHPGGHVLAVGHGIAMRTLAWSLLGGGHDTFRGLKLPNLGRVDVVVDADTIALLGGAWPTFE